MSGLETRDSTGILADSSRLVSPWLNLFRLDSTRLETHFFAEKTQLKTSFQTQVYFFCCKNQSCKKILEKIYKIIVFTQSSSARLDSTRLVSVFDSTRLGSTKGSRGSTRVQILENRTRLDSAKSGLGTSPERRRSGLRREGSRSPSFSPFSFLRVMTSKLRKQKRERNKRVKKGSF